MRERTASGLLGASVLAWAVLGLTAEAGEGPSLVRLLIAALNATVGIALLLRANRERAGTWPSVAASLPALVAGGLALRATRAPADWPAHAEALFALGALLAMVSIASLGRSFAILPSVREVVVRGPFGLVRHPTYAGELMMVVACAVAAPSPFSVTVAAAAVPFVALRVRAEEHLLSAEAAYVDYAARVPWRLLPHVW